MPPESAASAERPFPRPLRVLTVDDNPLFLEAADLVLSDAGDLEVIGRAGDGAEGVERASALRPDVVVMDVDMPLMDGFEATRRITSGLEATAVVMVTGSTLAADRERALLAGACAFVTKDELVTGLVAAVRAAGAQAGSPARVSPGGSRSII